ncbi:zinc ribbon domain-containing protein YjdM [Aerococcaceae bacterium WGS1372]
MENIPNCPQCQSEYTYEDQGLFICPECGFDWTQADADAAEEANAIRDSNGNILEDGDDVIVVKDLKVKGFRNAIKQGTKVKNIKLVIDPADGHDIDCKIDGFGAMKLKSEFVKKA